MANVMWTAIDADSAAEVGNTEQLTRLKIENATLRELLTAGKQSLASPVGTRSTQTEENAGGDTSTASSDAASDWNATVMYSAQSLTPRVARKFASSRPGIVIGPSSPGVANDHQQDIEHSPMGDYLPEDPELSPPVSSESTDDADETLSESSVVGTRDDFEDNVSVHTLGEDNLD